MNVKVVGAQSKLKLAEVAETREITGWFGGSQRRDPGNREQILLC